MNQKTVQQTLIGRILLDVNVFIIFLFVRIVHTADRGEKIKGQKIRFEIFAYGIISQ